MQEEAQSDACSKSGALHVQSIHLGLELFASWAAPTTRPTHLVNNGGVSQDLHSGLLLSGLLLATAPHMGIHN